jgi:hypothetical protein
MHKRECLVEVIAPALLAMLLLLSLCSSAAAQGSEAASPWGPETPNFNLEVVLRGEGFGHVKFRQPNDDAFIVYLDVWLPTSHRTQATFSSGRSTPTSTTTARAQLG